MAKMYPELSDTHAEFIAAQKIFFVGTATADSRVNVSPKGLDSLRIVDKNRIVWLNVTGSSNETAAHVQIAPRMTLMFCAFEGDPLILRVYGKAQVVHHQDPQWSALSSLFPPIPGARQIFDLSIDLVMTSCGTGVPFFTYAGEREMLPAWALRKGEAGLKDYWETRNQTSIDGLPTHILKKNL